MPDDEATPNPDSQAESDEGQSQEDNGESSGSDAGAEALSKEEARKLRSEARNLRSRLKDAESKLSERDREEMSELEKLREDTTSKDERISTLEKLNRTLSVQVVAARVGIRPEATQAAAALLDWEDIDDPDDQKQIEKALRNLAKDHSYLVGTEGVDAGEGRDEGSGNGAGGDMNQRLRRAAGIV